MPRNSMDRSNGARTTIEVLGSRVHNLKDISVTVPRDQLIVVTGLSGSGKSSLAFDTIYAEGQRRYMESLSSFAKRFIAQIEKPDVDFVHGLSPVVSIEQKTIARNPRSTVGTLTDISSYLHLLYATISEAHCPYTDEPVPSLKSGVILEQLLSLPEGTQIEIQAPIFLVYGEEPSFIFTEVRKQGCRSAIIDGERVDLTDEVPQMVANESHLRAVVDTFTISDDIDKQLKAGIEHALRVGDSLLTIDIQGGMSKKGKDHFMSTFGSKTHHLVYGDIEPDFFQFNNPESACRTCSGIGTAKITHRELLVTNPERSIREGCFLRDAYTYKVDTHAGYVMYALSQDHDFDLDEPWENLSPEQQDIVLYGPGKPIQLQIPPDVKERKERWLRWPSNYAGVAGSIERHYRWYRQRDVPSSGMEAYLDRVMVEQLCADCHGSRLRATRRLFPNQRQRYP